MREKKALRPGFSLGDLLRQAAREAGEDFDGLPMKELATLAGRSREWTRQQLNDLQEGGRLVVRFKRTRGMDGRLYQTPVYAVKGETGGDLELDTE